MSNNNFTHTEASAFGISLIIIITLLWILYNYTVINRLNEEKSNLETRIQGCEYRVDDYRSALEEANNNIEEVNLIIEDAQGYVWSSYDEMGEALDNLSTVETIDEP
jgi:hypothetical protein